MSVLLKKPLFEGVSQKELVEQLEAKKKSEAKLPSWFSKQGIFYPNKLNIEQTSSEKTAAYKTRIVDGKSLLDLTGGFGVDSFYFSKKIEAVTHCELDDQLSKIAAHNFKQLGVTNCGFVVGNGIEFLKKVETTYDWIYVDPSRRHDVKGKVFRLADCTPNIPENLDLLLEHADRVLLKASPLLDLTLALKELRYVSEIHVVAVQNEVKELLFILQKDVEQPVIVKTSNLGKESEQQFSFVWDEEKEEIAEYGLAGRYLYEPNAAILKAGGFMSVSAQFDLSKVAPHSHLYTAKNQIDFPGRVFEIVSIHPYSKKTMKTVVGSKANVTTRNFPETVAQLRKKHRIFEGGDTYLFFTSDNEGNRLVLHCQKV